MLPDPADTFLVRYLLDEALRDRADADLPATLADEVAAQPDMSNLPSTGSMSPYVLEVSSDLIPADLAWARISAMAP